GLLYVGLGDGGPQEDPNGYSQNLGSLLGKILRIDVGDGSGAEPYAIPPSNPFRTTAGGRPEGWARGLREPGRVDLARPSGALWGPATAARTGTRRSASAGPGRTTAGTCSRGSSCSLTATGGRESGTSRRC